MNELDEAAHRVTEGHHQLKVGSRERREELDEGVHPVLYSEDDSRACQHITASEIAFQAGGCTQQPAASRWRKTELTLLLRQTQSARVSKEGKAMSTFRAVCSRS